MGDGNRLNPRFAGCAGEEDYIGKICGLAKSNVHAATVAKRALERAQLGLNVHLLQLKLQGVP